MGGRSNKATRPFSRAVQRWLHVGGGTDGDGNVIGMPWLLVRARMIDNLCQRYSCLPSQLLAEDADLIFGIQAILALASEDAPDNKAQNMEEQLANLSRLQHGQ